MPKALPKVFDLNIYLASIDAYPLLSAEDEKRLAKRIQSQGDPEAREILINSNLRLVVNIARQFMVSGNRRSLPDLIEEGNMGLIQAAGRFRPEDYDTRFSTYASWWIKQSIQHGLKNGNWPMRIPAYMHTLLSALRRDGISDPSQLDTPEGLEILKRVRGSRGNWAKTIQQVKRAMMAASMGSVEGSAESSCDFLLEQNSNVPEAADIHIAKEDFEVVFRVINEDLEEREREVIKGRYGIGCEPMTLREMGDAMGITRERVRQIESLAMEKIKSKCLVPA